MSHINVMADPEPTSVDNTLLESSVEYCSEDDDSDKDDEACDFSVNKNEIIL